MKEFIAIGDIAGRFTEMEQLIKLCPANIHIVSLGDPNDRGYDSRKVIEFFMADTTNRTLIQSNHAHMMIDFWENNNEYDEYIFLANGGITTALSYQVAISDELEKNVMMIMFGYYSQAILDATIEMIVDVRIEFISKVPKEHIEFLKSCPLYVETDDVIMTHAPINPTFPLETDIKSKRGLAFVWNRGGTRRRDKFQIHGHMANKSVVELKDRKGLYGLNVDSSRGDILSAVHWPSMQIFSVPYIKP